MGVVAIEEPFPLHAVPRVWAWTQQFRDRVADDFGPQTLDEFVQQWERDAVAGRRTWIVLRDGEMGGVITSRKISPMVADAHCIFKREFWGQGTTAEALRLVFEQVFLSGVEKISAMTFADNHALLGLVKRLGFEREGLLRSQTKRNGVAADVVIVGVTKDRFQNQAAGRAA